MDRVCVYTDSPIAVPKRPKSLALCTVALRFLFIASVFCCARIPWWAAVLAATSGIVEMAVLGMSKTRRIDRAGHMDAERAALAWQTVAHRIVPSARLFIRTGLGVGPAIFVDRADSISLESPAVVAALGLSVVVVIFDVLDFFARDAPAAMPMSAAKFEGMPESERPALRSRNRTAGYHPVPTARSWPFALAVIGAALTVAGMFICLEDVHEFIRSGTTMNYNLLPAGILAAATAVCKGAEEMLSLSNQHKTPFVPRSPPRRRNPVVLVVIAGLGVAVILMNLWPVAGLSHDNLATAGSVVASAVLLAGTVVMSWAPWMMTSYIIELVFRAYYAPVDVIYPLKKKDD